MKKIAFAAGAILLVGCGKTAETTDKNSDQKPEAASKDAQSSETKLAPSEKTSVTKPTAKAASESKGLAIGPMLKCLAVYEHLEAAYPSDYDGSEEHKSKTIDACENDWSASYRLCMNNTKDKYEPQGCERKVRKQECELSYQRLSALAAHEGKSDPTLVSKKSSYTEHCIDAKSSNRKCLMESTTLVQYSKCATPAIAEVMASKELGWNLEEVEKWVWPAYAKGRGAERLSQEVVEADSLIVRPTFRVECTKEGLELKIWSKLYLENSGRRATKMKTNLEIDGKSTAWETTIHLNEHLVFSDSADLAKELVGHNTLQVSFRTPQNKPIAFPFRIDGIDEVLHQLGDCASVPQRP